MEERVEQSVPIDSLEATVSLKQMRAASRKAEWREAFAKAKRKVDRKLVAQLQQTRRPDPDDVAVGATIRAKVRAKARWFKNL
jgi:hypothetical protein